MFEKQRATDVEEAEVEVGEDLQEEFDRKHAEKKGETSSQVKILLAFANEQIKKQALEIKNLKDKLPKELNEEEGDHED